MPQPTRRRRCLAWIGAAIAAIVAVGCSGGGHDDDWGHEAQRRFDMLSAALGEDDVYSILDFYSPGATVQSRTSDFQDARVPVFDYLVSHRADLSQDPVAVHLGEEEAVVLVAWPAAGRSGAIATTMDPTGAITSEVVLVDVASLDRSLLASPDVVDRYTELYQSYARAWSTSEGAPASMLYADDATIRDALNGSGGGSAATFASSSANPDWIEVLDLRSLGHAGASSSEPALYLDPVSFGEDPLRAVGVYDVVVDGCTVQTAVMWQLDDTGHVIAETHYPEIESYRDCRPGETPDGWWTELGAPTPRDEIVTGVLETPRGREIDVFNGTERLMELITWGLDRFAAAGLDEPQLDSVTFEPTRRCEGVGGRVTAGDEAHALVLCIDEPDLCGGADPCAAPLLAIRSAMLHEMGHAWLHDNTDAALRDRLLEVSGRSVWSDTDVPWAQRGVEYAAEVISWGLLDDAIELEQLGSPPCEELHRALTVLTGLSQPMTRSACPTD